MKCGALEEPLQATLGFEDGEEDYKEVEDIRRIAQNIKC